MILTINDRQAELQAIGSQNQELWTQNGLLREQNQTLKNMVVAIEDLAYLLKVVQDAENKPPAVPPAPKPKYPCDGGRAATGVRSQGPGNSGASGESWDALFASP